jgi:hypothetical protein
MILPDLVAKWTPVLVAGGWPPLGLIYQSDYLVDLARELLQARVQQRALVGLLINRGVITQAQYDTAVGTVVDAVDTELTTRFPKS